MGTWKIEVEGAGIHHNRRADDANVMAAAFVAALRSAGHGIKAARFVLTNTDGSPADGGTDDISDSGAFLSAEAGAVDTGRDGGA